mmetsp:Transcript_10234/g.15451  ORF Transcript_10234/g.15451 Transcript_10234/m.15451 type:complete len:151 (+) Transcript_10234:212-664(+)
MLEPTSPRNNPKFGITYAVSAEKRTTNVRNRVFGLEPSNGKNMSSITSLTGNIMIGKVKYKPIQRANLTTVADVPSRFNVMGASVAAPNAKYPQHPKTAISAVMANSVFFNREGNHFLSAHDDSSGSTIPTPSKAYNETDDTYSTLEKLN